MSPESPESPRYSEDEPHHRQSYRQHDQESNRSALLQLLKSYSAFMNESAHTILDMDLVLSGLMDAVKKLKPPSA